MLLSRATPFETAALDIEIRKFFATPVIGNANLSVGQCMWGVYAFYDYDDEPIYVGQTNERLSSRVRRHLTNRRTDAVAMSVLDPFEVFSVSVWPLPQFQGLTKKTDKAAFGTALLYLNDLEAAVYEKCVGDSKFGAVLNEKIPLAKNPVVPPQEYRGDIITPEVEKLRGHPDIRLARRAATIARLALIISERTIKQGLRRTLLVQAERLEWLAKQRLAAFAKEVKKEDRNGGKDADE